MAAQVVVWRGLAAAWPRCAKGLPSRTDEIQPVLKTAPFLALVHTQRLKFRHCAPLSRYDGVDHLNEIGKLGDVARFKVFV